MRRLLVPVVLGMVVAMAGCQGIKVKLDTSPTKHSPSHSKSHSKSSPRAVPGAGPVSAGSGALRVIAEPQAGLSAIYKLIKGARSWIELTMYELRDSTAEGDLAAAAKRGVDVRVILDAHLERSRNTATYTFLRAHGVHVTWAPSGTTYHQKTLTVDNRTSVIMTLNMVSADYADTRDFAVFDTSRADVAAVVATFNADYAHRKVSPPDGADLVWSPTNSQAAILAVIDGARHTLSIENEEMAYSVIITAIENAAKRGVSVKITMTRESSWDNAFTALTKAGAHVRLYRNSTKVIYIHAKAVVADAGLSDRQVYLGSENFSFSSLRRNRELGIRTTNKPVISEVSAVLAADYAGATPF
ncbi:cardiolipin synthase [Trebonia kvetii]|uniref:phospholipase D n=1 Tax=Trebonia kvetii TaxID=2480626 RepID=A0A6P2BPM3_9ACTN|nr:phospholipase D-like domain-containing protein [Trebonia kvetii]TVZ00798.1 cardiolipin synthase [Trebonia kvetii]